MADISNLKINEGANVDELMRITKIENEIYIKEQIWDLAKLRVMRNIEFRRPIPKFANF